MENAIASPPGTVDSLFPPESTLTPEPSYTPTNVPSMNPSTLGTATGIGTQIGTVLGIVFGTGSEGGGSNTPSPATTSMPILLLSGNNYNNATGDYEAINGTYAAESGYPMTPTFTPTSIGTELLVNVSVISSTNTTDWFVQNDKEEALSNVTSLISEGDCPSSPHHSYPVLSCPVLPYPVLRHYIFPV